MREMQNQTSTDSEQVTAASACPHPEAVGKRWGDPISEDRQAELKSLADMQREWVATPETLRGNSHFKGVTLTGADVFWLAACTLDSKDVESAKESLRHGTEFLLRFFLDLSALHLEDASLEEAHLEEANFHLAHFERVNFVRAHLERAYLRDVRLEGANFIGAHLEDANLYHAHLEGAHLNEAYMQRAILAGAHLKLAYLDRAHLEEANLFEDDSSVMLDRGETDLGQASLREAHLEGTILREAHLEGADLTGASMDKTTRISGVRLDGASFDQIVFDNANLTVVDWSLVTILGDEATARTTYHVRGLPGVTKDNITRLSEFKSAVRANRVLAVALRTQGLNEDADRFAYRAQVVQRVVLRRQRKFGRYLGSLFLDLISGYGYRPMRSLITYILVILGFAATYFALGGANGQPLSWNEAIVVSMTAFHGRGFFAAVFQPGDVQAAVAAVEAFIGLLIEIVFIATFTQRFFAR
jgi:uncharacterized protein YjbI with pentapeptide repeats